MKGMSILVVTVTALFLFSTAHAISMPTDESGWTTMCNQREHIIDPASIVSLQYDDLIARCDSATLDSFILAACSTYHIPGLATWCLKDGQVIWQRCYGYANLEDSIEVADTTLFTLFSISKTITGTAIMQLWEQGLFGLDDDINDYLPFSVRCPAYPDSAITFRMLMTHTSSIHDNNPILNPLWVAWGDSPIPLGTFLEEYLVPGGSYYSTANYNGSVPGTQYEYSNVGIGLLGYLVEAIEDSFPIHCQDSIFNPLSMYETSWFLANLDTSNLARAYHWTGGFYNRRPWWGGPFYPSFQLRASVTELARYLTAIMQYGVIDTVRILDSTTVELILTHQFELVTDWWIGLVWHHAGCIFTGRWVWFHNGAGDGGDTFMAFCPDENSAVISLTNCDNYECSWYIAGALFEYAGQHGIEECEKSKPHAVSLRINPNPFHSTTTIRYSILGIRHSIQKPVMGIYDATGRLVKSFNSGSSIQNEESAVVWDGTDRYDRQLSSGVYFLNIQVGTYSATEKILLIR